jgi:uroporphyrinogen decarboxylase
MPTIGFGVASVTARLERPDRSPDPFLAACRGEPVRHTPVWFMRQAGRSLPEYRARRGRGTILDAIRHPDLAAELTVQPVQRYGVDAAILFSDIMVPVAAIGFGVEVRAGIGPVTDSPFQSSADLQRLRPLEPASDLPWMGEAIRILVKELRVPLIGFAGGPFTLASYLVEGRPSREYTKTKALMHGDPALWRALVERLADLSAASLREQIDAGVQAVQVFDSWAGALSPSDYQRFVLPAATRIFESIADADVPMIHFGVGTGELLGLMTSAGASVIGVDWRVPLGQAAQRAPTALALQGNLDPGVCLAPWPAVETEARRILRDRPQQVGHIFNLGHGVLPETNPDCLRRLVDLVHEETASH